MVGIRYEYFLKEYPFQAAVRNSEILGIFSLRVGTDVFLALRERGMNTIFSGVRLYLGGITIIRLSSYVQDAELSLFYCIKQSAPRGCAARREEISCKATLLARAEFASKF